MILSSMLSARVYILLTPSQFPASLLHFFHHNPYLLLTLLQLLFCLCQCRLQLNILIMTNDQRRVADYTA
jgi:hypothetical protein